MNTKQLIEFYLDESDEILSNPLYNQLEVGFRHSPLTIKEQNERLLDAIQMVRNNLGQLRNLLARTHDIS